MKYAYLCLVALFPAFLLAQEITCSHPQLCNIVRELYSHQLPPDLQLRSLDLKGDPHHFEPGTRELSGLMRAPFLIAGPKELHPWIAPVLVHRQKAQLTTLILDIDPGIAQKYSPSSLEALSHFWLLPELHCQYSHSIAATLKQWLGAHLIVDCEDKSLAVLQSRLNQLNHKKMIVLSHDALEPQLRSMGFDVFTLKGSHHGESITPETMKGLLNIQKQAAPMIWVFEHGIKVPAAIEKLKRPQDLAVLIDVLGRQERPSKGPLKNFLRELIKAHTL